MRAAHHTALLLAQEHLRPLVRIVRVSEPPQPRWTLVAQFRWVHACGEHLCELLVA